MQTLSTETEHSRALEPREYGEELGGEPALPFFVCGVGASAGGLEALTEFFSAAKLGAGVAYVVVQHLSPDFKSMMVELLTRHTPLKAVEITDGTIPEPDTVYLLGPKRTLTIEGGRFSLEDRDLGRVVLPINLFLTSLATDQKELCAAVILSGSGTDGTHGARAIKDAGGLVLAQEPGTAKFDGMPTSVIGTNLVDQVAGPAELCQLVASYAQHPIVRAPKAARDKTEQEAVGEIVRALRYQTKIDFALYKRGTITRRIQRRTSLLGLGTVQDYLSKVRGDRDEMALLSKEMLIGVTQFFRDSEVWAQLETAILPELVASMPDHSTLRIWCAGCATGEEAFTLAILLQEQIRLSQRPLNYRLFATDVRADSLAFARTATYPLAACEMVPPHLKERYFEAQGDRYVVRRSLRDSVTFAQHDMLADPPFTQLNLITCRNVLIYFSHEAQQRCFARFRHALTPGGLLMLGLSESVGESNPNFQTLNKRANVFAARGNPPASAALMVTPTRLGRLDEPASRGGAKTTELLLTTIVERRGPPGVVVDTNLDLVQTLGDVSAYLRVPQGRASLSLLKMVSQPVAVLLNTGARKALAQDEDVELPDVAFENEKGKLLRNVRICPILKSPGLAPCLLVFFDEPQTPAATELRGVELEVAVRQRIQQLEDELTIARENLHAAVQDLEATNEELQATNEELTVSNEELQSTNEELQSVNEELYTVNTEYQQKIQELETLNSDLENLLRVMGAGVVFLDQNLQIRRFNEAATLLLPMRREDLGRPLQDIALRADFQNLVSAAEDVLKTGLKFNRRILGYDGTWWSLGMRVFQASALEPRGVIVTMQEISELTRASARLSLLERTQEMAEEMAGFGHAIVDLTTELVTYSKGAQLVLGLPDGEMPLSDALARFAPSERPQLSEGLARVKDGLDLAFAVERELQRADGIKVPARISVQARTDATTGSRLLLAVFQIGAGNVARLRAQS